MKRFFQEKPRFTVKKRIRKSFLAILLICAVFCNAGTSTPVSAAQDFEIWVGGVGMRSGDYLASGSDAISTQAPVGGYAYYDGEALILHNYTYAGVGHKYLNGFFAGIYRVGDLTLVLEGENSIRMSEAVESEGIHTTGCLTVTEGGEGGTLTLHADYGIYLPNRGMTVNGGSLEVAATRYGIFTCSTLLVNGGTLDIRSTDTAWDAAYCAICTGAPLQFSNGLTVLASDDPNTEPTPYDPEQLSSYDRITVGTPPPTVHTSLAFTLFGYEFGGRITGVSVEAVENAVQFDSAYGIGFVILDRTLQPLADGSFEGNTRYALQLRFRMHGTDQLDIPTAHPEQITLNGIGAEALDEREGVYTVTFPLPLLESTDPPISTPSDSIIRSIELSAPFDTPTVGEALYYPTVKSINGDEGLTDLLSFPADTLLWSVDRTRYTESFFQSGAIYTLTGRLIAKEGAVLAPNLSVTLQTPVEVRSLAYTLSNGACAFEISYDLSTPPETPDTPPPPITPPTETSAPPETSAPTEASTSTAPIPDEPLPTPPVPTTEEITDPTLGIGKVLSIIAVSLVLLGIPTYLFYRRRRK